MKRFIRKLLAAALAGVLAVLLAACGSGVSGGGAPAETQNKDRTVPGVALSAEEFVYHGIHMKLPDVFEMVHTESTSEVDYDYYGSQWKGQPPEGYMPGSISFALTYNSELDTWDTSITDEYSPYSARIYYAEGSFEGRGSDAWTYERTRLGGVDVLFQQRELTYDDGKTTGTETGLYVILQSCAVEIRYSSNTDQFARLFEEVVDSLWVEEAQIPDLVKLTEPEALTEAGLRTEAWEYNGLYLHMPSGYTLVDTGNDGQVWLADKSSSNLIYVMDGETDMVGFDAEQWESVVSRTNGFLEMNGCSRGNFNGMYYSYSSYLSAGRNGDQRLRNDWIAILPRPYGCDKAVVIVWIYPEDDTETDELGTRMLNTVHCADGWIGEGLLEAEPVSLEEFTASLQN